MIKPSSKSFKKERFIYILLFLYGLWMLGLSCYGFLNGVKLSSWLLAITGLGFSLCAGYRLFRIRTLIKA